MAMTDCRQCGLRVGDDASKCPHCGTIWPVTAAKRAHGRRLLWLAVLLFIPLAAYSATVVRHGGATPCSALLASMVRDLDRAM